MSTAANLPLRDIHLDLAPAWWPPAPGWWMLLGAVLLVAAIWGTWWWRRRARRRAVRRLFDTALETATTPAAQVAAMSELLRRAARRVRPDADRLPDAQWRVLLQQGDEGVALDAASARLLVEGGYRPEVQPRDVEALRALAWRRFEHWMQAGGRR